MLENEVGTLVDLIFFALEGLEHELALLRGELLQDHVVDPLVVIHFVIFREGHVETF